MCFGQKENFFSILQNGQALRPVLKIAAWIKIQEIEGERERES
jgi:hypothetical protein